MTEPTSLLVGPPLRRGRRACRSQKIFEGRARYPSKRWRTPTACCSRTSPAGYRDALLPCAPLHCTHPEFGLADGVFHHVAGSGPPLVYIHHQQPGLLLQPRPVLLTLDTQLRGRLTLLLGTRLSNINILSSSDL